MIFKLVSVLVVTLFVTRASALICPTDGPCLLPGRIIRLTPRPPTTTQVPFTTPSMVDTQTWNFTHPSVVAKDCINSIGNSIVTYCQNKSEADYSPDKMNTPTSTTWETCCSLFEELSCYTENAVNFCPAATRNALVAYSQKLAAYFNHVFCSTIPFTNWKSACNNETHAQASKAANETLDKNPNLKFNFVKLPPDDGPEKACFTKLRSATLANNTQVDLEEQCEDTSMDKWDPNRRKIMESGIVEACCAIYDSLDCIEKKSTSVCSNSEQSDLTNYKKKSLIAFSNSICKTVPYEKAGKLCSVKGGAYATVPSILTSLIVTLFLFMTFH